MPVRGPDACQRLIIIGVEVIAGIEPITTVLLR